MTAKTQPGAIPADVRKLADTTVRAFDGSTSYLEMKRAVAEAIMQDRAGPKADAEAIARLLWERFASNSDGPWPTAMAGVYRSLAAEIITLCTDRSTLPVQPETPGVIDALRNLTKEMRHMLCTNPKKDGGLYRQRLEEAESVLSTIIDGRARREPMAIRDVIAERRRQVEAEGWTAEHDDCHGTGELAEAAACYAFYARYQPAGSPDLWPWDHQSWKPKNQRSNLVRAGALIVAEIERLDRALVHGGEA